MIRRNLHARLGAIENAAPDGPIPVILSYPPHEPIPSKEPLRSIELKIRAGEEITMDEWELRFCQPEDDDA